ncbi:unnamed protein product [Scytosiphon promiscuus]
MKLAVDKQYDQSRADARVRAALGGWYTAEHNAAQRRLGDGESVALNISFSKGAGTKSEFTETVDRIPREQVAAVVRMIARDPESREMLKPHNFAGCSPRMFWSLVQHWGGDVPSALRLAAPDVDWAFLDTRDRKPSEKAVANAEPGVDTCSETSSPHGQYKMSHNTPVSPEPVAEGAQTDSSEDEEEQPQTVTAAEEVTGILLTASQQRPAPAAAAGEGGGAVTMAVAPPEEAADQEDGVGRAEGEDEEEVDMEGLTELAGEAGAGLLVAAGIRTLGQLADRDEEELAQELGVLQDKRRRERRDVGDSAASSGGSGGPAAAPAARFRSGSRVRGGTSWTRSWRTFSETTRM